MISAGEMTFQQATHTLLGRLFVMYSISLQNLNKDKIFAILLYLLFRGLTQWAKSPKKQSVWSVFLTIWHCISSAEL